MKIYSNTNVLDEANKRIDYIFQEFNNIEIAFSGGKDSGVMIELVLDYIKEHKPKNTVSLYTLDYEAGYDQTTNYVNYIIEKVKPYMDIYNICLPIKAQCCVNSTDEYWTPWNPEQKEIWVRDLPEDSINYLNNDFDFDYQHMTDYEFNTAFSQYLHRKNNAKQTAVLVGVRADESLNRLRIFYQTENKYKDTIYSTKLDENIYTMYPIYDWSTDDIWTYNGKYNKKYNELYDLMYQAGIPIGSMRVASPFNDSAGQSLHFYKVINPNMWGKMIGRVEGVNCAAIYGNTSVYAWKDIKLPKGHTWESYTNFLLSTLPEKTRNRYIEKFNTSIKFWKEKGSALSDEVIKQLDEVNMKYVNHGPISKQSKNDVITFDFYPDSLDIKDWRSIGSWKRCAVAILKNDHTCKTLGFAPNKDERLKRKKAEDMIKDSNIDIIVNKKGSK